MSLPQSVPGGMHRVRAAVPLLNARPVPPGVHHDVAWPIPVTVTLRWATGVEVIDTVALEWTRTLVRVRIADLRVMTGAVWVPADDVRRPNTARTAVEDQAAQARRFTTVTERAGGRAQWTPTHPGQGLTKRKPRATHPRSHRRLGRRAARLGAV